MMKGAVARISERREALAVVIVTGDDSCRHAAVVAQQQALPWEIT